MKELEFIIPLILPSGAHSASGLSIKGTYYTAFAAMVLPALAESRSDVALIFEQVSVLLRLTPQSSNLRTRMLHALCSKPEEHLHKQTKTLNVAYTVNLRSAELTSLDAALEEICEIGPSGELSIIEKRPLFDVDHSEQRGEFISQLTHHWRSHLFAQMLEMFLPFETGNRDWQTERVTRKSLTHGSILSWEVFFSHEIPMRCEFEGREYRLVDFFIKSSSMPFGKNIIPCLLSTTDSASSQSYAVATLVLNQENHKFEEIECKVKNLNVERVLREIENQYPFPLKTALLLRWEFLSNMLK